MSEDNDSNTIPGVRKMGNGNGKNGLPEKIAIVTVTFTWSVTQLVAAFHREWRPDPSVGLVMGALIGGIWGIRALRGGRNDNGNSGAS